MVIGGTFASSAMTFIRKRSSRVSRSPVVRGVTAVARASLQQLKADFEAYLDPCRVSGGTLRRCGAMVPRVARDVVLRAILEDLRCELKRRKRTKLIGPWH
jgi:hypothetical protein